MLDSTARRLTHRPRRPDWRRSLVLAIGIHVVLAIVVWQLAVRLGVTTSRQSEDSTAGLGKSGDVPGRHVPVILQAMNSIRSGRAAVPLAAYGETDDSVEWQFSPHERVGVGWDQRDAPLVGYHDPSDDMKTPLPPRHASTRAEPTVRK